MTSNPKPDLTDVTLCAADSIHPALAARALRISSAQCTFSESILFTHEAITDCGARIELIPPLQSIEDYSAFMAKDLVHHIATPWVLVIQWDGYVVHPAAWSNEFFDYDYVGAPWPFHQDGLNVGNGGFSLRSAKLLKALSDSRFQFPRGTNEDELICRTYRPVLEAEYGIRFAPAEVAARFAYERSVPSRATFGFHGAFNMWRHVDDDTMMNIVGTLDDRTFTTSEVLLLMMVYCDLRKFDCVKSMYERYRRLWSPQEVAQNMLKTNVEPQIVPHYADFCESVMKSTREQSGWRAENGSTL